MLARQHKLTREKDEIEAEISMAVGFWNEISVKKEELKKLYRMLNRISTNDDIQTSRSGTVKDRRH
jgi:hypothetical protein